ncbi:MAG: tRNA lysidine(34) synthetase TilS [Rhodobacteraceae bacterium]|nr:tRNA lysidine(34) synthetase TilS [Paracoccaceae bacterium]
MSPRTELAAAVDAAMEAALPDADGARIGAAVSGGGDSMALLVLLADWAQRHGAVIEVASVDHGLRAGATEELAGVAALTGQLKLRHETLTWTGWDGTGNLQAAARDGRYDLLRGWASARRLSHVCLGHTRDDQAETLLMRLARGSGVDGLAAMAPARRDGDLTWVRPLLEVSRADLRQMLEDRGLAWAEDPSNDDIRYDRVRARRLLAEMATLGLSAEDLAKTALRMRAARRVLAEAAAQAADRFVRIEAGDIVLDREGFFALPDETRWRLFAGALCQVSGAAYRPRFEALKRTLADLESGARATLHGCLCQGDAATLRVGREPAAVAGPVPAPGLWDGRWRITCPAGSGLTADALGEAGLAERPGWRETGLARTTMLTSPALWEGPRLHAALMIDDNSDSRAELIWGKSEFRAFLLSD